MGVSIFDMIVKKMLRKKEKLVSIDDIKSIVGSVFALLDDRVYSDAKTYKYLHHLKARGFVLAIKKDLFYITQPDADIDVTMVIDEKYWQILYAYCRRYFTPSEFYIGGVKALELHLGNYTVPTSVDIMNTYKKSNQVVVSEHAVSFKTYFHNDKNLFSVLKKYTDRFTIDKKHFRVASKELALLESLYSPSMAQGVYTVEIVKKIIKKYAIQLEPQIFSAVLRAGKHHASMNRLYEYIRPIDKVLAQECYDIIKKYSFVIQ